MDMNTINFLKENYEQRTLELSNSFKTTNSILDKLLNDLNSYIQKLQKDKNYNETLEVVRIQRKINIEMESNNETLKYLKFDKEPIKETKNKAKKTKRTKTKKSKSKTDNVNYDEYSVDTKIPHELNEDFRHKRPHAFTIKGDYIEISTWKEMLVKTSEYLYNLNPKIFKSFIDDKSLSWGGKINFTKDKSLVRDGALIEGSNIYIETSKDSIAVKQLIIKMISKYEIKTSDYQVFLRADYTPLHEYKKTDNVANNK